MHGLLWACLIWPAALSAQVTSSVTQEKLPTTRDPSYVPPLISEELQLGKESSVFLTLFGQGDGSLDSYLQSRREARLREKRETGRFREREDYRMLQKGYKQALLEQRLLEQFDAAGFPSNMGRYPYSESAARRFSVVFLLALPVTGALGFGSIALYKSARGDTGGLSNSESIAGALFSIGAALGIAIYDYRRVFRYQQALQREEWPPSLKTRNGMIDREEKDLPPADQGLFLPYPPVHQRNNTSQTLHSLPVFAVQIRF